jgi:glycosyltransferase involved in cell wall biosynthesis
VRVLHLIQRYPPAVGGSETWCREVARYLSAMGDDVKVLTLDILKEEEYWKEPDPDHWRVQLGRIDWDDGVLVRRYKRSLPIHLLHHLVFRLMLDKLLRIYFYGPHSVEMYGRLFAEAKVADVVHLHTIPYPHNFVGYLAARLRKKRVVITPHFHPDHPHYERWSNFWLLRRCDAVIAVSEYERDYLMKQGVDPAKIIVTGNGVHLQDYIAHGLEQFEAELRRRHRLSPATKIILFVGRKLEYKGIATLVAAVRHVLAADDVVLLLAGPSSTWYEKFYGTLSAKDRERIIDLGTVSDQEKINLLHLAEVLVLPSRFEAFGIVFLEAWACGTPVIGAATGAIPSVVGEGGLTFPYGDAIQLAEKLRTMLHDQNLAHAMASRGQHRLRSRFTWDHIGWLTRESYRPDPARGFRILICSSFFPPHYLGGAELVADKQAKILQQMGHDVRVFSGRLGGHWFRTHRVRHENAAFQITRVSLSAQDISGISWDFNSPDSRREFCRTLDDFSPNVVHFHNIVGLSIGMIDECYRRRIPTVMTLHDYWGICFKNTLLKNNGTICKQGGLVCLDCREMLAGRLPLPSPVRNAHILFALRQVNRLITPSRYVAAQYAANGIPSDKIIVIQNGIDAENFAPGQRRTTELTLGFIGHLGQHKGLDVLLHALSLMDASQVRLLVVGTGEDAERFQTFCHERGLDPYVTFYGHVENRRIATIYQQIDVLVVPSVWPENSPVTITEAMASGIPVIASDVGGIGELVEDGVTGYLIPLRDSLAIADRIGRFLARPELLKTMGERALAKIQAYQLRQQVERIVDVYQEVIAQRQPLPKLDFDVLLYDAETPWNMEIREMFSRLTEAEEKLGRRLLVCRADLAVDEVWEEARLLIIPTPGPQSYAYALQALRRQVPILVPQDVEALRDLCLVSNAGLIYGNSDELKECLMLLLSDAPLRQALGSNGRAFFEGRGPSFTVPTAIP